MLKKCTSAGTAAQKRSKCRLLERPALLSAILLLSAVCCQAQFSDTALTSTHGITFTTGTLKADSAFFVKDSCWWTKKTDTIQTDFVITVDANNFVKKQKTDFIIHNYEIKDCRYSVQGLWVRNTRNDVYLLDGISVEVLLYRPKNQYGVLVGNSR